MKKVLLVLLILFMLCGCGKEASNDGEDKLYDDYIGMEYIEKYELKCEELKDSKYMSFEIFTTNDGKVYQYGRDKLFSNDQNCRQFDEKLDTGWSGPVTIGEIVGLRNTELIDSKMNQIEARIDENKLAVMGEYIYYLTGAKEWHFTSENILTRDNDKMYLVEFQEGKVEIKNSLPTDEKIISVNGDLIKTDKGYYSLKNKKLNREECEKYDDVECELEYYIIPNELANKLSDKIYNAYPSFNDFGTEGFVEVLFVYAKNGFMYEIRND